jgi:hypothetical protein
MKNKSRSRTLWGALLVAVTAATAVLYAQELSLRPGNYEFVVTSQMTLPPEIAAKLPPGYADKMGQPHVSQRCITDTDVAHVSQKIAEMREREQQQGCKLTDQSKSGNEFKGTLQCSNHASTFDMFYSGDSIKGTVVSTTDKGQKMTINISAHRIGDCAK